MDEAVLRQKLQSLATDKAVARDLLDDVCCLPATNSHLVISKDMLVENVHFPLAMPGGLVASRALRSNLSDLAAKGAVPWGYLLGLSLPMQRPDMSEWVDDFIASLAELQSYYGLSLWGGDSVASEQLLVSITIMGHSDIVASQRCSAQEGDILAVTGVIGAAAYGLRLWQQGHHSDGSLLNDAQRYAWHAFTAPNIPCAFGAAAGKYFQASMDISDGLLLDIQRLCEASGAGAIIDWPAIPRLYPDAMPENQQGQDVLSGGDDYQILLSCRPKDWAALSAIARDTNTDLTAIGTITASQKEGQDCITLQNAQGRQLLLPAKRGYQHI